MTDMTPERLAELRAVAEAANADWDSKVPTVNLRRFHEATYPPTVLSLIDALEAARDDALTGMMQHARWQERAERAERERDEAEAKLGNGRCWDEGPRSMIPGYEPAPGPLCELTHGHAGAHHGSNAEWMHNRQPYDEVTRERDEARAEASKIEGRAVDWSKRAETAEAALERVKGTFFKNHLYLMMMSYPAFNNPAGEALHDKIDNLIQQTIEGTDE